MDFKSHLLRWQEMFSDRGTEYMAEVMQYLVESNRLTIYDIRQEIMTCESLMQIHEHGTTNFMFAWGKKELLKEVALDWERQMGR